MGKPGESPRGPTGRFLRTMETAERDAEACRLRSRAKTYQEIADELGYSDKTQARRGVERAMAEIITEPATEARAFELERLDFLHAQALAVLEREHVLVAGGKVVYDVGPDGDSPPQRMLDDKPVLAAIDRMLHVAERRAKLLGLDAPVKVQTDGTVRYEVAGVALDALQ